VSSELTLECRQIRELDRIATKEIGIPGLVLMENAARNCVQHLIVAMSETVPDRHSDVLIFCGGGNNGGDGLAMARLLAVFGLRSLILLLASPDQLRGDAAAQWQFVEKLGLARAVVPSQRWEDLPEPVQRADASTWLVDAILGTGAKPPLRSPLDDLVRQLNQLPARRMAVDIPTGLDADDPRPDSESPAFRADMTVTFVAKKPAMNSDHGRNVCGDIMIADIGAPLALLGRN